MVRWPGSACNIRRQLTWKLMTGVAIMVLAAGCTKTGKNKSLKAQLSQINYSQAPRRPALKPNHPLYIATAHWAGKHQKNPKDATAALSYARNLKALGSSGKAAEVLARTFQLNPGHGELASEYGRVALSLGKVQMAERLLNQASKAGQGRDWRVLSALGTVNSKRGAHKKAQTYYLAALRAKPGATSVYNNLALSYALDGRAGDAETLLKKAIAKGHDTPRVRQNLALVLGLQTKFGEAKQIAQVDLSGEKVNSDVAYLKSMVKTAKVARVSRPVKKSKPGTGSISTATLSPAKKTATPSRKNTAKNPTAKNTAAKAVTAPAKKLRKPVKTQAAKLASAQSKAGTRAKKPARPLPWQNKPGVPKSARKARPAPGKAANSPAILTPRTAETPWSTSVSRPASIRVSAVASSNQTGFEFPETE